MCIGADVADALQAVRMCSRLASYGLGSIVEACDSAPDFLVGCLQDWADTGALELQISALSASRKKMVEPPKCNMCDSKARYHNATDHSS